MIDSFITWLLMMSQREAVQINTTAQYKPGTPKFTHINISRKRYSGIQRTDSRRKGKTASRKPFVQVPFILKNSQ
jgi:hypothetical protein